jgi:hypothetical protein
MNVAKSQSLFLGGAGFHVYFFFQILGHGGDAQPWYKKKNKTVSDRSVRPNFLLFV